MVTQQLTGKLHQLKQRLEELDIEMAKKELDNIIEMVMSKRSPSQSEIPPLEVVQEY